MPARNPEELDRLFSEALNAGNLEALVALYDPQGHLVFGHGVAQPEKNELRVLSHVGPCFPGTLHMSQNPFSR